MKIQTGHQRPNEAADAVVVAGEEAKMAAEEDAAEAVAEVIPEARQDKDLQECLGHRARLRS